MLPRKAKVKRKVLAIPTELIDPSPFQARRHFDEKEIAQLAVSILENGLLQPVSVRRYGDRYQLVAGERRLRACKLAQLKEIPAILCEYQDQATAALGLLENLQRQDLDAFEQARGIQDVIALWGCTQEEAANRLGMAQPTLNNKLRLLQLSDAQQEFCRANNLTERHARAVLRLEEAQRLPALEAFAKQGMNARQADEYVQRLVQRTPRKKSIPMVRDVRIFVNTINKAVRLMVDAGVNASTRRVEGDGFVEYTVRIPTEQERPVSRTG
ncbi:ParB/RepB/Spo0J family partition protein [Fournierella massiliensis]|uniref:ParB/RepB/Spo0J family partition protein n=1 Tax=Allofournierella massiliensis TaxID=1650663 RepID=UPI003521B6F6